MANSQSSATRLSPGSYFIPGLRWGHYATLVFNAFIDFRIKPFVDISSSISKSSCKPSQNFAEFPKYLLNLKAVSAVILRLPLTISEILV